MVGVLAALLPGCSLEESNFSQYPGFSRYLESRPPAEKGASPREQAWLRAHRPVVFVAEEEPGPISFYRDYIDEGVIDYLSRGADTDERHLLARRIEHCAALCRERDTARNLRAAVERVYATEWDHERIEDDAEQYDVERFRRAWRTFCLDG